MNNVERIILKQAYERKQENFAEIETQRNLLEYAIRVIPTLETVKISIFGQKFCCDDTVEVTDDIMNSLLVALERFLSITVWENIEKDWKKLEVEKFLDALRAMKFYVSISRNCPNIQNAYNRILEHLKTRIDGEKLKSEVNELVLNAINYMNSQQHLYVIYNDVSGEKIPTISPENYVWVFTNKEEANNLIEANEEMKLSVKEFNLTEFRSYVNSWCRFGYEEFCLNSFNDDHTAIVTVDEYLGEPSKKYLSTNLNSILIKARQFEALSDKSLYKHLVNYAYNEMPKTLYLAPILYKGEKLEEPVEDYVLHTSKRSAELMMKASIENQLGVSLDEYAVEVDVNEEEKPTLNDEQTFSTFTDEKFCFYGADKYSFVHSQEGSGVQIGKVMTMRTVINSGHNFLPLFTDMVSLHAVFGEKVRVGMFTWEDILDRLDDKVIGPDGSISIIEGVVINPGLTNFAISAEDISRIGKSAEEQKSDSCEENDEMPVYKTPISHTNGEKGTNGFCKASFVLGIIALTFDLFPLTGFLSIIFGVLGKKEAKKENKDYSKATVGIILGTVGFVFKLFLWILILAS